MGMNCEECENTGYLDDEGTEICPVCDGKGFIDDVEGESY